MAAEQPLHHTTLPTSPLASASAGATVSASVGSVSSAVAAAMTAAAAASGGANVGSAASNAVNSGSSSKNINNSESNEQKNDSNCGGSSSDDGGSTAATSSVPPQQPHQRSSSGSSSNAVAGSTYGGDISLVPSHKLFLPIEQHIPPPPPPAHPVPPPMNAAPEAQQYCLRWNNFQSNIVTSFETLLKSGELVDVTLTAEGTNIRAHRVLLSACSDYFRNLFQDIPSHQHPVIVLQGVQFLHLKCLLCFIYHGEVNVSHAHLSPLLALAESLQVKGLARSDGIEVPRTGSAHYEYGERPGHSPEEEHMSEGGSPRHHAVSRRRKASSPIPHHHTPNKNPSVDRPPLLNALQSQQNSVHGSSPPSKRCRSSSGSGGHHDSRTASPPPPSHSHHHANANHHPHHQNAYSHNHGHHETAVNLSVSSPPRLVVPKMEKLELGDASDDQNRASRELLATSLAAKLATAAAAMKTSATADVSPPPPESDPEEEPPPHATDEDGEGEPPSGLSHHHMPPAFHPYPPTSRAVAAAAVHHHFAANFNAGPSNAVVPWRAPHPSDRNAHSPHQGTGHTVFSDLLMACGGNGGGEHSLAIPASANSTVNIGNTPTTPGGKKAVPTPCPICNKVLSNAYNMRVHLETHQDITYKCLICGIVTRTRDTMRKHLSNVHKLKNVHLKNSFKKITGGSTSPRTPELTPVKNSKSPPPLLTPSQAFAAHSAALRLAVSSANLQSSANQQSQLKSALTSALNVTLPSVVPLCSQPTPPALPSSLPTSELATFTSATINDVTAAAVAAATAAAFFPSFAAHSSPSPSLPSATDTPSPSSSLPTGNKLASIVSKLSQKQ